jgi:hypothetical protein
MFYNLKKSLKTFFISREANNLERVKKENIELKKEIEEIKAKLEKYNFYELENSLIQTSDAEKILQEKKKQRLLELEEKRKKEVERFEKLQYIEYYKELVKDLNISKDLLKKYNIFN